MKISKLGIVFRPDSEEIREKYLELENILKKYEITPVTDGVMDKVDAILTLGGDGTFLGAVRRNLGFGKPILGVHMGRLGFLAEAKFDEIEGIAKMLAEGTFEVKERMIIRMEVEENKSCRVEYAVNEVVIKGDSPTSFVGMKLYIGGKYVNSYLGDGLIIATPTGSTAYNLSAGGPIVFPYSDNYILTPIASHSLSQRPLILPTSIEDVEIRFEKENKLIAVIDGQIEISLAETDRVLIGKREYGFKVICRNESDFFKVLKSKLNWGDDRS